MSYFVKLSAEKDFEHRKKGNEIYETMQIFFFTSSIKKKIIIRDYLENNFLFILDLILFYATYLIFGSILV